jgi:SAM-dependent methyltransferase
MTDLPLQPRSADSLVQPPDETAPFPAALGLMPAPGPADWLRSLLGIRRSFTIHGVRYKELTAEPLARALSRRGTRAKEYAVSFPGGRRMRITVTPTRAYEDLSGPLLLDEYRLAAPYIRPGMRIVALRSGSGYAAAWLAGMVGPSGSVVALDPDQEAIGYARWRYRFDNVSFEVGDHTALSGETANAFDGALAIRALREGSQATDALSELWRTLAPGGCLIATAPTVPAESGDPALALTSESLASLLAEPARRQAAASMANHNLPEQAEPDNPPAPTKPPAPPPNPEIRILPAPRLVAAAMVRKTPNDA